MNKISLLGALAVSAVSMSGCTSFSPGDLARPGSVTVENAMVDIGKGFSGMNRALKAGKTKLGIDVCKVTVNFHVTSGADKSGTLVLDLKAAPPATSTVTTVSAGANLTQTNTSHTDVGNMIDIEMYNVACLPKDTLGYDKPGKVQAVVDALASNRKHRPPGQPFSLTVPGTPPLPQAITPPNGTTSQAPKTVP
nr:hypothetical protein [uncultured Gellertiella sp.]